MSLVPSEMSVLSLISLSLTPSSFSAACTEAGGKKYSTDPEGRPAQLFHLYPHAYMQSHVGICQRASVVPRGLGVPGNPWLSESGCLTLHLVHQSGHLQQQLLQSSLGLGPSHPSGKYLSLTHLEGLSHSHCSHRGHIPRPPCHEVQRWSPGEPGRRWGQRDLCCASLAPAMGALRT